MIRDQPRSARTAPTKKRKSAGGGGGTPSAPGAVQAYLLLAPLRRAAPLLRLRGALLVPVGADPRAGHQDRRRREAPARAAGDQGAGGRPRGRSGRPSSSKVDLIERLKAEQSGPVHMLDEVSQGAARLRLAHRPGPDRAPTSSSRARATASPRSPTSSAPCERSGWFPDVDLASSTEANNIVTFALHGHLQEPGGGGQGGGRRGGRDARSPAPPAAPAAAADSGREREHMADNALTKLSPGRPARRLASSLAAPDRRALLVLLLLARGRGARARRRRSSKRLRQGDPRPRGDREQAAGVPARGRAAGGEARDPEADPAPGQGDART